MQPTRLLFLLISFSVAEDCFQDYYINNYHFKDRRDRVMVAIKEEDLERILASKSPLESTNITIKNCTIPFLTEFNQFLIEYQWTESTKRNVLAEAAEYNKNNFSSNSNDSIRIWLSFEPRYGHDIEDDAEKILDAVRKVNIIYPGTVLTVVLDYGKLFLDPESLSLINHEIRMVSQKVKRESGGNLTLGLQLELLNCESRSEYLKGIKFNLIDSFLLISKQKNTAFIENNYDVYLSVIRLNPCWKFILDESIPIVVDRHVQIKIDFENSLYQYNRGLVQEEFTNTIPIVLSAVDGKIGTKKEMKHYDRAENELQMIRWLQQPYEFNRKYFGAVITFDGKVTNRYVIRRFSKFLVEIDFNGLEKQLEVLDEAFNYSHFTKFSMNENTKFLPELRIPLKIIMLVSIEKNDFEISKEQIDRAISGVKVINQLFPGTVNEMVFDSVACVTTEICNGFEHINASPMCSYLMTNDYLDDLLTYTISELEKDIDTAAVKVGYTDDRQIWEKMVKAGPSTIHGVPIVKNCTIHLKNSDAEFEYDFRMCKVVVHDKDVKQNGVIKTYNDIITRLNVCSYTDENAYYVSFVGCKDNFSSIFELAEVARLYERLNAWATNNNKTIYVNAGIENPGACQQNVSTESLCKCGWWVVTNIISDNQQELVTVDKRTLALQLHQKKQQSLSVDKPGHKSTNIQETIMWALWTTTFLGVSATFVAVVLVHRYQSKYIMTKEEIASFIKGRLPNYTDNPICDGSESAQREPYNKNKFELPTSSFTIDTSICLGSGEFGKVYCGTLQQYGIKRETAVKVANVRTLGKSHGGRLAVNGLLSEIKILSYLGEHNHIVCLLGAYTAKLRKGDISIFLELCEMGSLYKYLRSINPQTVNAPFPANKSDIHLIELITRDNNLHKTLDDDLANELNRYAGQIACGMEFLASKNVVHADLAARNVLLTSEKVVKISDFGLSRRMYDYSEYVKQNQAPLPWRWMAPESLRRMIFSEKTDVWAFGITLWEIFTLGDEPYPGLSWHVNFPEMLARGLHPNVPRYNTKEIYSVMKRCWKIISCDRPTFAELNLELKEMQEEVDKQ